MGIGDWPESPVPGLTVAEATDEQIEGELVPWLFEQANTRQLIVYLLQQLRYMEIAARTPDTEGEGET